MKSGQGRHLRTRASRLAAAGKRARDYDNDFDCDTRVLHHGRSSKCVLRKCSAVDDSCEENSCSISAEHSYLDSNQMKYSPVYMALHDSDLLVSILSFSIAQSNSIDEALSILYNACLVSKSWAGVIHGAYNLWLDALGLDWVFDTSNKSKDAIEFLRGTQGPLPTSTLSSIIDLEAVKSDFARRNIAIELDPAGVMDINYGIVAFEHVKLDEGIAAIVIGHESVGSSGRRYISMTTIIVDYPSSNCIESKDAQINEIFDISTADNEVKVTYWPNTMIRLKSRLKHLPPKLTNSNLLTLINIACFTHSVPCSMNLLSASHSFYKEHIPNITYFDELQLCCSRFDKAESSTVLTRGLGDHTVTEINTKGSVLPTLKIKKGKLRDVFICFGSANKNMRFKKETCPPNGVLIGPASQWNRGYFLHGS